MVSNIHPGQKVYYQPGYKKKSEAENGIVKSICDDPAYVFVVYNFNHKPEDYCEYTAARTRLADLFDGWIIDGKCKLQSKLAEMKVFGLNEDL